MPDTREPEESSSSSSSSQLGQEQLLLNTVPTDTDTENAGPSLNGVSSTRTSDSNQSASESEQEKSVEKETKNAKKRESRRLASAHINLEPLGTSYKQVEGSSHTRLFHHFKTNIFPLYEPKAIPKVVNMYDPNFPNGSRQSRPQMQYTPLQRMWPQMQPAMFQSAPGTPPSSGALSSPGALPALPQYINNVVQHPLLNACFARQNSQTVENMFKHKEIERAMMQAHISDQSKFRKKKKESQKKVNETNSFEPYFEELQIAEGLKNNTLLEGTLRINPKQFQFAYVSGSDRSEPDIFINGLKHRNRALEGDVVVIQLLTDGESEDSGEETLKKRGKVVYIREKNHKRICLGTLKLMPDKNRKRALFIPRDSRVPRLNIPCTSWPDNFYNDAKRYEQTLFMAKIFDWFDTRFALGKIVCLIGQSGDMVSESRAILAQNDLDVKPFSSELRKLFPGDDYSIPEEEIKLREDCRQLCLFSIDPYNCRDIDDAVSCRQLENGNYEIGVHISDVAHYLSEDTPLDEQVAEKATTIYMVEQAYHMLPDELCVLCSLFPGEDKLAFSVFWEITDDAKVLNHRFAKTVIHSCCQLAYDHAQAILDDKEDAQSTFPEIYNGQKYEDVKNTIKTIGKISAIFRNNRFETGALRIDQPKVSFKLSPSNLLPESFSIYDSKTSHQLIEEFMLLANMTVAKRIYEDFPELAFLRCHPPPSLHMMRQLQKSLIPMGIDLDITSAGSVHRSLTEYAGPDADDKGRAMVLSMLCAKPMARAKYFCAGSTEEDEDFAHYALNVPLYTHFTSPIRRYADIMVHRLLAASLKYREAPKWEVDRVRAIAAQCNKQKYNAKRAGEMSTELYTLKYIQMHSPLVTDAVVVDVREKFIDVIIVAMGLNRRIYFNNDFLGKVKCIKNDAGAKLSKLEISWKATKTEPEVTQVVQVFSVLAVELTEGEDVAKVETKLVRPPATSETE